MRMATMSPVLKLGITGPAQRLQTGRLHQRGMTMIEVLVTFVILAVGVLGIVSLLATSKTSEFESVQRSRAVTLADSLLEKIRANPAALSTEYADPNEPFTEILPELTLDTTEPSPNCIATSCTPDQKARHDLWAWKRALLGGDVTVVDAGNTVAAADLTEVRGCTVFQPFAGKTNTGYVQVLVQWTGLQETTDGVGPDDVRCGGDPVNTDPFRRAVTVSTFVADEADT